MHCCKVKAGVCDEGHVVVPVVSRRGRSGHCRHVFGRQRGGLRWGLCIPYPICFYDFHVSIKSYQGHHMRGGRVRSRGTHFRCPRAPGHVGSAGHAYRYGFDELVACSKGGRCSSGHRVGGKEGFMQGFYAWMHRSAEHCH